MTPSFLAGNVATTWNTDSNDNNISQTFYSYDLYGRVQWIVQNIPILGVKTIDYEYDPITSQVLKVIYQKDHAEQFIHQYTYNIAQELEKVETQAGNNALVTHADYTYYETGALKRTEIAGGIQGIDYVYNLAGQLKAINHPNLSNTDDPGNDANDLFGMTLDYYSGDYKRNNNFSLPISGTDQYNGNIKGMTWNTNTDNVVTPPFQYSYEYNKNNWLTQANFNANGNTQSTVADLVLDTPISTTTNAEATNSITLKATATAGFHLKATSSVTFSAKIGSGGVNGTFATTDYKVSGLEYDANGNILKLNRNKNTEDINGTPSNKMDELTYEYYETEGNPNQLKRVDDAITQQTNADDIKDQTTTNNYEYNSIGQLTENVGEGVKYEYNASGLVTKVFYNNFVKVQFFYNDKGYRTKKVTNKDNSNTVIDKTTHYVLDAAGSTLAIYENNTLQELPIYGASRLGIYKKSSSTSVYQLTDHLGNVRAVIAKDGNGNAAALVSATDYYPFGMPMPGRRIVGGYRYQYQGQEVDPETGKEAFQLRLWDGRIGRWLTTDPAGQYASPYLGMGNDPINAIDPDGGFTIYTHGDRSVEVKDGVNKTVEVNAEQFAIAQIFAGIINPTESIGLLSFSPVNSDEFAESYYSFYSSVNKYLDGNALPNIRDWLFVKPKIAQESDFIKGGSGVLSYISGGGVLGNLGKSSKFLFWGNNAKGHLVKRAPILGFNVSSQVAQKILPELKIVVNQLLNKAVPSLTRVGKWHGH
jgi:RHS repeat-associated protein